MNYQFPSFSESCFGGGLGREVRLERMKTEWGSRKEKRWI